MSTGAPALPWTHRGKRPREWFRKSEATHDPGTELGTDQLGQDGKTSQGRKWFSYEWWGGHHHQRAADGSYSTWEGTGKVKAPAGGKWASTYKPKAKAPTRASTHFAAQVEYTTHLHRLESQASAATNGFMITPAGKAKGYTGADFFAFSTAHRPAARYMSPELRSWMGHSNAAADDNHGGGLSTFRSWQAAKKDTPDDHGPWTNRKRTKK